MNDLDPSGFEDRLPLAVDEDGRLGQGEDNAPDAGVQNVFDTRTFSRTPDATRLQRREQGAVLQIQSALGRLAEGDFLGVPAGSQLETVARRQKAVRLNDDRPDRKGLVRLRAKARQLDGHREPGRESIFRTGHRPPRIRKRIDDRLTPTGRGLSGWPRRTRRSSPGRATLPRR